jgi:2-C-methyl-D-erythritol 4-phosphate cytidylyltransferase
MKTCAVIVAGGSSTRIVGTVPKQFRDLSGRPMLAETVSRFETASSIDQIVVVVSEEHLLYTSERVIDPYAFGKVLKIVVGGATRFESVWNGIKSLPISTGFVAIHDGARPLVLPTYIDRVVETARRERAAILADPVTDTVKRVQDGYILATLDRSLLHLAQTPQVFQYDLFKAACEKAITEGNAASYTDDAALCEASGFKVRVVAPTGPNFKVTTNDDLELVRMIIRERNHG